MTHWEPVCHTGRGFASKGASVRYELPPVAATLQRALSRNVTTAAARSPARIQVGAKVQYIMFVLVMSNT